MDQQGCSSIADISTRIIVSCTVTAGKDTVKFSSVNLDHCSRNRSGIATSIDILYSVVAAMDMHGGNVWGNN